MKFIIIHQSSWFLTNNHELNNETNQVHNNSSQFMKQSFMNFRELVMNRIKTYQVYNNSLKFMKLSHKLSWTSYELNRFYQFYKKSWLFMNLSIWTSWTKSWTTLVHQVFINIHDLSWTVLMNNSWTQFMNWLDEPLMNVHECSWTIINVNVHHLMNFISPEKCHRGLRMGWKVLQIYYWYIWGRHNVLLIYWKVSQTITNILKSVTQY